ncbi:nitronate monooxygenase [Streptomyces sp. NBC_00445]|uniref:nitronate monooxygenase n=1 Tax=Streptomyces sp. NBC_00445 TaxID=2975745 RepID=UPI003FCCCFA2
MTGLERALAFCERFGMRLPVLQAPMAGSSPVELAVEVAEAGGMGARGALQDTPDRIAAWVDQFRARSSGPLQLNVWIPERPGNHPEDHRRRTDDARAFLSRFGPPGETAPTDHPVFDEQDGRVPGHLAAGVPGDGRRQDAWRVIRRRCHRCQRRRTAKRSTARVPPSTRTPKP